VTRPVTFWIAILAALIAVIVLLHQVLLPFVAGMALAYLLEVAIVDRWIPPARRNTVQTLASEVNNTIRRFVLGQAALCIILGLFYMIALSLIGLEHGLLIGLVVGLIGFVPYLGSLTGLLVSTRKTEPSWDGQRQF